MPKFVMGGGLRRRIDCQGCGYTGLFYSQRQYLSFLRLHRTRCEYTAANYDNFSRIGWTQYQRSGDTSDGWNITQSMEYHSIDRELDGVIEQLNSPTVEAPVELREITVEELLSKLDIDVTTLFTMYVKYGETTHTLTFDPAQTRAIDIIKAVIGEENDPSTCFLQIPTNNGRSVMEPMEYIASRSPLQEGLTAYIHPRARGGGKGDEEFVDQSEYI